MPVVQRWDCVDQQLVYFACELSNSRDGRPVLWDAERVVVREQSVADNDAVSEVLVAVGETEYVGISG